MGKHLAMRAVLLEFHCLRITSRFVRSVRSHRSLSIHSSKNFSCRNSTEEGHSSPWSSINGRDKIGWGVSMAFKHVKMKSWGSWFAPNTKRNLRKFVSHCYCGHRSLEAGSDVVFMRTENRYYGAANSTLRQTELALIQCGKSNIELDIYIYLFYELKASLN